MIDGGVFWGRHPVSGLELTDIPSFLDRRGSRAAIVSSLHSLWVDAAQGDEALLGLARAHPGRIIPAVTAWPWGYEGPGRLRRLQDAGARVLAVLPGMYETPWDSRALGGLVREAAACGLVVQLGVSDAASMAGAVRACGDIPATVLLRRLGGGGYFDAAEVLALARDLPHWLFDLGGMTLLGAVERLVGKAGAERFFLATNAPLDHPDCAEALIGLSDLSNQAKQSILGGNLARVFGLEAPSEVGGAAATRVKDLEALGVIDCHLHLDGFNLLYSGDGPATAAVERWAGRCRAVVASSALALGGALTEGNSRTEAFCRQPGRFGLAVVDPSRRERSLEEIRRYAGHPRFVGLKTVQDGWGIGLDHPDYRPLLALGQELDMTVLAHIPGMAAAARAHPGLRFVCAHAAWDRVRDTGLVELPNVFFDFSTSGRSADAGLDVLARRAGPQRIVFGSDAGLIHPAWSLAKLGHYAFDRAVLGAMLHGNALRAFPRLEKAMREAA